MTTDKIKILTGIILYKINVSESASYKTLVEALNYYNENSAKHLITVSLLLIDNSPNHHIPVNFKYKYLHFSSNPGLSFCYNKMISLAEEENFSYLNFFDHDSIVDLDYFIEIEKILESSNPEIVAPQVVQDGSTLLISPFRDFYGKGFHFKERNFQNVVDLAGISCINSGLLVKRDLFRDIGLYNPLLPLDLSDNYFFRECRKKHKKLHILPITIHHSLSSLEKQSLPKTLKRFETYLKAIKVYAQIPKEKTVLNLFAILRLMKLCIKFKSLSFIKCYLNSIFSGAHLK